LCRFECRAMSLRRRLEMANAVKHDVSVTSMNLRGILQGSRSGIRRR
jgi:hypothetical protein